MKKTTIFLGATLCIGIAQVTTLHISNAQPAPLSFNQVLTVGQQDLTNRDFGAAEEDAHGLLVLARSPQEKAQALELLGEALYRRGAYDEAREQWQAVLDLTDTANDKNTRARAHLGLARSYNAQGSYDKAVPHYQAAINDFDQKGGRDVKQLTALFSLALADALYNARQNDLAQEQLNRAAAAQNIPQLLMLTYTRAGQIDFEQRKFDKARADYQQVLQQEKVANLDSRLSTFATNQIASLNTMKDIVGEGTLPENHTFVVERSVEFDQKVSQVIAEAVDEMLLNKVVMGKINA